MLTTSANLAIVTRDLDRSLATVAKDPQVKREQAYFLANIGKIKSVDEFLANRRVFAFAMEAFGLSDMVYAKAFMKKVLKDGIDSRQSFANQLSDQRFREFATTFNFARYGGATTAFDRAQQGTAARYVRMKLEERVGATDEGARLALYFQRKAADIVSPYNILGDAALLRVAQTALGIPAAASSQDITKQAAEISAKLDFEDLKNPEFLAKFLDRFAHRWQIANGSSAADVPQLLLGNPVESAVNPSTLLAMQSIRRR